MLLFTIQINSFIIKSIVKPGRIRVHSGINYTNTKVNKYSQITPPIVNLC